MQNMHAGGIHLRWVKDKLCLRSFSYPWEAQAPWHMEKTLNLTRPTAHAEAWTIDKQDKQATWGSEGQDKWAHIAG